MYPGSVVVHVFLIISVEVRIGVAVVAEGFIVTGARIEIAIAGT